MTELGEQVRDIKNRIIHLKAGESRKTDSSVSEFYEMKALGSDTNGHFSAFMATLKEPYPLHVHEWDDENFLVIEGEVEVYMGGQIYRATEGDWVTLPFGVPHAPRPVTETAKVFAIQAPGGFEHLAEAMLGLRDQDSGSRFAGDAYSIAAAKWGWTLLDPDFWPNRLADQNSHG